MLQIGDQFDHFKVDAYIAQGGMSDIYRAIDLTNGKPVALKIPNRFMIGDPAQFERFHREMEVTKTLDHPAIQKGIAAGQYNRTPFIATELVEGESLREFMRTKAPLPIDEAIALTRKSPTCTQVPLASLKSSATRPSNKMPQDGRAGSANRPASPMQ